MSDLQYTAAGGDSNSTEMVGHDNTAMSEIELSDSVDNGEEQVDIGFKDLQSNNVPNMYVGKRNFIHQLMDVALLMANVSQLKALLSLETSDKYYIPLFIFIGASILLQVVFTLSMLAIWSIEKNLEEHSAEHVHKVYPEDPKRKKMADRLDKIGNILVLLIIVSNVFITGIGVEPHGGMSFNVIAAPLTPLNPTTVINNTVH